MLLPTYLNLSLGVYQSLSELQPEGEREEPLRHRMDALPLLQWPLQLQPRGYAQPQGSCQNLVVINDLQRVLKYGRMGQTEV